MQLGTESFFKERHRLSVEPSRGGRAPVFKPGVVNENPIRCWHEGWIPGQFVFEMCPGENAGTEQIMRIQTDTNQRSKALIWL